MKQEFWDACYGEEVGDAEGKLVRRADTEKVKEILDQVKPEQLLELLLWENKYGWTGLDVCLECKYEECITTIVTHVMTTRDVKALTVVFPYAASVKSTDLVSRILQIVPNTRELLEAQTHDTKQTVLHVACDSGNKVAVELLLPQLQTYGILQEELFRSDNEGRTPLCLAQAEKKRKWDLWMNGGMGGWEVVESDESHRDRTDTATAMLEWIKENMKQDPNILKQDPDLLEEVIKW